MVFNAEISLTADFCADSLSKEFLITRHERTRRLINSSRDEKYGGREPSKRRKARVASWYSTQNLAGSQ